LNLQIFGLYYNSLKKVFTTCAVYAIAMSAGTSHMPNRITAVEVWLSPYLPLEDMIVNYPPRRMQGAMIVVIQPVK
jgi:hypothetical protein